MISTLILVVTLSSTALAWGNNGHQATGIVAQSFLDQKTTGTVSSLLNQVDSAFNGQLTLGTLWADKVKFGKYRWSSTYHYAASVDDFKAGKCSYKDIRDCPDGKCVVGAISNYTRRMECKIRNNKLDLDRAEAVLFVAHFVGDIAQPLHVVLSFNLVCQRTRR